MLAKISAIFKQKLSFENGAEECIVQISARAFQRQGSSCRAVDSCAILNWSSLSMYFSYVPSIIFSFFNRPLFLNLLFKQILIPTQIRHSIQYSAAKIGVDTTENEPPKVQITGFSDQRSKLRLFQFLRIWHVILFLPSLLFFFPVSPSTKKERKQHSVQSQAKGDECSV